MKPAAFGLLGLGLLLAAITVPLVAGEGASIVVVLLGSGLAGCLWFVTQWNTPAVGSAVLFTVGLVGWGAFPAVAAHAAIAYPSGHLTSTRDRRAVRTGYVVLLVVFGLAPALVFDTVASG